MSPMHSLHLLLAALSLSGTGQLWAAEAQSMAMPLAEARKAPLVAVAQAGQRLVAVGDHGVVVLSDNDQDWRQARRVEVDSLLTALSFANAQQGWAVGHGDVVLHSTDGGETWSLQQRLDEQPVLLSAWFENARHGVVVGAYDYAVETRDGGQSWQRLNIGEAGDDYHFNHVFAAPNGNLFFAAEMGNAYRSTDRGATWQALNTGANSSLWTGTALGDGRILLACMSGRVLLSADQGDTWQEIDSGSHESITAIQVLADERVALVGNGGLVAMTDAALQRFSARVREDRQNLSALAPQGKDGFLVLGQSGIQSDVPAR